jgi:hypothetical protein
VRHYEKVEAAMESKQVRGAKGQAAYEKPVVRRIKLVKGELAVAGCKATSSHTGPTTGCVRSGCKMPGS